MTQGPERTVSYQPEERYWTDYLRIALPVAGLLLLIGLFWFWAGRVIGDGNDSPPDDNVAVIVDDEDDAASPAPGGTATEGASALRTDTAATSAPGNATTDGAPTPTPPPPTPSPTPAPSPAPATEGGFAVGAFVITTEEGVRLRDQPSTDGQIVAELPQGAVLEVTEAAVNGSDGTWWPVRNPSTNELGFVFGDFLRAQDG